MKMTALTPKTLITLGVLCAAALPAYPAFAQTTITAENSTTTAGGTGYFDVDLFNSLTGSAISPAGFSFELTVSGTSGVTFTDATTSTALPYIFTGNSFNAANGFAFSTISSSGTDVTASDLANTGSALVSPGGSFGLGRVFYSIAPGTAAGPVSVSFAGNGTSLSDTNGDAIPITTRGGTITVPSASAAPEPSQIAALTAFGLVLGGSLILRVRRRSQPVA